MVSKLSYSMAFMSLGICPMVTDSASVTWKTSKTRFRRQKKKRYVMAIYNIIYGII